MVERDDAAGAAPLGGEGEVPVPGADVEHGATGQAGEAKRVELGGELLRALRAIADDAVSEVERVEPQDRVGFLAQAAGTGAAG